MAQAKELLSSVVNGINDLKTEAPICNYKDLILANFSDIVLY